jgi:hypothetical protein
VNSYLHSPSFFGLGVAESTAPARIHDQTFQPTTLRAAVTVGESAHCEAAITLGFS